MNTRKHKQRSGHLNCTSILPRCQRGRFVGEGYCRFVLQNIIFVVLACALGGAKTAHAQQADYTDLRSLRAQALNNDFGASVDFQATVTYVNDAREFIFVQKDDDAIFVFRPDVDYILPGHQVRVVGRLAKGDLLPIVSNPAVTVLGKGQLPTPKKISEIKLEHDCQYSTLEFDILQTFVGVSSTLLYSKSDSGKEVIIQIQHPDGLVFPDVRELAGSRVQCTGVLGLQIAGGAFRTPGKQENEIVGYKILCNSFDNLKVIRKQESDSTLTQQVGLSTLKKNRCPDGRFSTFAQICLIEDTQPPTILACNGDISLRLNLQAKCDLHPGMLMRLGGLKQTNDFGKPQFEVDYLRHLGMAELSQPNPVSIKQAIKTFEIDRRISVEAKPLRIEDRDGRQQLILEEGDSTVVVNFQDDSADALSSLDPSIAQKVKITGITKKDNRHDFRMDVIHASDAQLVQRKTSISRILAIALGTLVLLCGLSAIWIKLLKGKVDQQRRFEAIFDNAGCPIFVINGNLKIIAANQVAADLTGYSKEQLRTMSIPEIDKQASVMQIKEMLLKTMQLKQLTVFPTKIQTQDKRELDVEVHCRNLTASDVPEKSTYITVFPDVTERNQYERELREARDEAIKANDAKSKFVAAMSHELRTPINGVIGMTQLLASTELTPTQADYLAACRSSGETLLAAIEDVLDFSQMEASKLKLEPQPTKLIPFIENILRATSLQQGTPDVDLASFIDPRLSRSVMVDGNRLRQVFFNLLGNATKFTSQGSITVNAKCAEVTDQYAHVRFVVSDTGIGIPADKIPQLFDAFEQVDSSTTRQYGGTGLGLTICKQIIDLMGGEISVTSEVGRGSVFIIDVQLPFAQDQSDTREDQITPTQKRVAVVGVSPPIARFLRQMFDSYQVDASFYRETDILLEDEIDIVLLNNPGDLNSVRNFIDQQYAWSADKAPIVIPVVPPGCTIELKEWKRKGIAEPLFKPFTQSRFVQPLAARQKRGMHQQTGHTAAIAPPSNALRVLICEDNDVNRKFAKEICRNAGIQAVVRENGRLAIETLETDDRFDAIFMDCNMPVMDGFEAAGKIREMTESGAIAKIPVIAVTANALPGDKEKCLEAGMDDYLAKPYEIEEFLQMIETHTGVTVAKAKTIARPSQPSQAIFNFEKLLGQFNDRKFVLDLAEQFASVLPEFRSDFQGGLSQQDNEQVLKVAHRLKGTSATVQAERIHAIAGEIEAAGRAGQVEQVELQIAEVLREFDNFVDVLQKQNAARETKQDDATPQTF